MTIHKDQFSSIFNSCINKRNEDVEHKSVAILVQHSPDPDCLGAAAGMAILLKEVYDLQSEIFHYGEISHPQNKSMKNILHISLKDGSDFKINNHCATIVLDTDLTSTGFKSGSFKAADVRIDHHSMDRDDDTKYKDIRTVGSTCAIIWQYLKEFGVDISKHPDTATAMVLGIKTDTLDFTSVNTSELDMEAYRDLLPHVNKQALAKVNKFPLPKQVFEAERIAFEQKQIKGTVLTSFIGDISAHDRDIIATIADRFARMEGINTVVIMAVVENNLHASIRSDDSRVEVAELCRKVFGKDFSGAKEGSGGARVPLGKAFELITSSETKDDVMKEMVKNISEKVFDTLGVQE